MSKTYQEVVEYINSHKIRGRHEMRKIRDYLIDAFPDRRDGFNLYVSRTKLSSEITYEDFLKFIEV